MKSKATKRKQTHFIIENSTVNDWKDAQQIMQLFPISIRTLRYYRKNKIVPSSKLGGKVFYYLPGFLKVLEASAS